MLLLSIASKEKHHVVTADIAGAYLNAEMDDFVLVKFKGPALNIMYKVNPEYTKLIQKENGQNMMYLQLAKALYRCLKSALLWYNLFSSTLKDMGFVLNKYDPCAANKRINEKQFTIGWWVDDNAMTHVDMKFMNEIITGIEDKFGTLAITCGERHTFLGMKLWFPGDKLVYILMWDHIQEAIDALGEPLTGKVSTLATCDLFEVDNATSMLTVECRGRFRSVVMKVQWIAEQGRPDVQLPVSYLTTRLTKATSQDWRKLQRVMMYLHNTIDDGRVMGIEDLGVIHIWIDASYAIHPDMKRLTGGVMSYGLGIIYTQSSKEANI